MSLRALIGITCSVRKPKAGVVQEGEYFLMERYVSAVMAAGGSPLILPPTCDAEVAESFLSALDGVIISGGVDLPPEFYGESPHETTETDEGMRWRAAFEKALVERALEQRKPTLGICHGCQLLNVALGGSLYQDIPTQIPNALPHRIRDESGPARHLVEIETLSKLERLLGATEIEVVSSHHQALKAIGSGLSAVARAPDGVVEAVEHVNHPFFIGVQWHPEMTPEAEHTRRLMWEFVKVCKESRSRD